MTDVLEALEEWAAAGEAVAVATVTAVRRSAPRPPGAKMAMSGSSDVVGMVSGGCVEGAVVQEALEVLAGGPPRLLHFGIADDEAWEVGLPCGGEIDVWVERLRARQRVRRPVADGRPRGRDHAPSRATSSGASCSCARTGRPRATSTPRRPWPTPRS